MSDIQEALKILKFRYGRKVAFHPVVVARGVRCYSVDGTLRPESEIVTLTGRARPPHPPPPSEPRP